MSAQPRRRLRPPAFDGAHTTRAEAAIMRFVNRTPGAPAPPVDDRPAHALVEARSTRCARDNLPIATANLTPSIVMARHGRPNP